MFRPYKVILKPSKKTDLRVVYISLHCGIPNAYKLQKLVSICLLEWPEDDLIMSKHVAVTKYTIFVYK